MANDFVQAGAHALWVAVVVQRAWIRTATNRFIVNEDVDVVGGHPRLDDLARHPKDVGGHVARVAHALDDLRCLYA